MKYETVHNLTLPKIGFGTWKIGGESSPNPKVDSGSLAALRSALECGYTHIDTSEMYAAGHTEELIGQVIREMRIQRESLFITSKVMPSHLKYDQVLKSCEASLRRLQMDYVDLYLIHWPSAGMNLEDTFRALNQLVKSQINVIDSESCAVSVWTVPGDPRLMRYFRVPYRWTGSPATTGPASVSVGRIWTL